MERVTAQASCTPCPVATYKEVTAMEDRCEQCSQGRITLTEGATGPEACTDAPVEFSNFNPSEYLLLTE